MDAILRLDLRLDLRGFLLHRRLGRGCLLLAVLTPAAAAEGRAGGGGDDDIRVVELGLVPSGSTIHGLILAEVDAAFENGELLLERDGDGDVHGHLAHVVHVGARPRELLGRDHDGLEVSRRRRRGLLLQGLLGTLHPRGGALLPQLGRPVSLLLLAHLGAFAARALRAGAQPLELRDALAVEHHAVRVWTLAELGGVAKARRPVGVARARHAGEVEDEPADGALAVVRAVRVARGKQALRVVQGVQRGVLSSRGVRLERCIRLGFDPRRRPRILRVLSHHGGGRELPRRVPSGAHDAVGEKLLAGPAFLVGQPLQVSDEPPGGFLRGRIRRGDAEKLVVAEHRGFAVEPVPLHAVAPEPEPVRRGEVDRLGDVETGVESAVVRLGEGDHEFTRALIRPVHGDALTDQERGREHGDEL